MDKNKNLPIIGFLGTQGSLFRSLQTCIKDYSKTHPVHFVCLDPDKINIQYLIDNSITTLIVDMRFDSIALDRLFNDIKCSYYPGRLYTMAATFTITDKILTRAKNLGIGFVYQLSGQIVEETKFLSETAINTIYSANPIRRNFAVASIKQDTILQAPVFMKKISLDTISFASNVKVNDKNLFSIKHDYLKKLNWRESNLSVLSVEPCLRELHEWTTTLKTELIKPEEIDRFELEFNKKYPNPLGIDKTKEFLNFINPIAIEKRQNLNNFYRRHRFNCEQQDKMNILLFSKTNLNFRLKREEFLNSFNLFKKQVVNPSLTIVNKVAPQLIFFELEPTPEDLSAKDILYKHNDITTLRFLFHRLQELKLYIPLIVFNNEIVPAEELASMKSFKDSFIEVPSAFEDSFMYSFLKNKIAPEVPATRTQLNFNSTKIPQPIIYPEDRDYSNLGSIEVSAKIESLTENEILISTTNDLPDFTMLKLNHYFNFYITIIPNEKLGTKNGGLIKNYHGVVNGITAEERDALRGFVITFNKENAA